LSSAIPPYGLSVSTREGTPYDLHRAAAALFAISFRCCAVSAFVLAAARIFLMAAAQRSLWSLRNGPAWTEGRRAVSAYVANAASNTVRRSSMVNGLMILFVLYHQD
jgi:hypothetical protein